MAKQPLNFQVLEQPVMTCGAAGRRRHALKQYKALVRQDTGDVLAVVNHTYKVVQFPELLRHLEQQIRQVFPAADFSVTQTAALGGRVGYVEYVFPELLTDALDLNKRVRFRLIVSNSFGFDRVKFYSGAIDGFCTNGMVFGEYNAAFWRHTKNLDIRTKFAEQIEKCLDKFFENAKKLRDWMERRVKPADVDAFFGALPVSDKLRERLAAQYQVQERRQRGETLWSVYSALTYYASHNSEAFPVRNTGRDHAPITLMRRQQTVAKWTQLPEWEAMAA